MPNGQLTSQSRNLATHLCHFLDIKGADYYVMQSLMIVISFYELKLEEAILAEEFGYSYISQVHTDFRWIVLTHMKKETEELQVDLKPHHLDEVNLYNKVVLKDEGEVFSSIPVGHSLVEQTPKD